VVAHAPIATCAARTSATPPRLSRHWSHSAGASAHRSFVAYAVQKSLSPVLTAYAHAAFDNFTNYLGLLGEARENYKGPKEALGYTETPQDLYFPATISQIHYFTPGFMYQQAKPAQVVQMTSFGLTCNANASSTKMGKASATIPTFILDDLPKGRLTPKASPAPGLTPADSGAPSTGPSSEDVGFAAALQP
jgi:hypothetical protein